MAPVTASTVALALLLATLTAAHDHVHHARDHKGPAKRQLPDYPTGPQYDVPTNIADIHALPPSYSENVIPGALQTFAPGTASPIDGAPTLPSLATFDPKVYPPLDTIPPTDTDQVKEWVDAIDWSTIPQIPPTNSKACDDPKNQQALAEAGPNGRCWWSCGQCLRDVDITTCGKTISKYKNAGLSIHLEFCDKLHQTRVRLAQLASGLRDHPPTQPIYQQLGNLVNSLPWDFGSAQNASTVDDWRTFLGFNEMQMKKIFVQFKVVILDALLDEQQEAFDEIPDTRMFNTFAQEITFPWLPIYKDHGFIIDGLRHVHTKTTKQLNRYGDKQERRLTEELIAATNDITFLRIFNDLDAAGITGYPKSFELEHVSVAKGSPLAQVTKKKGKRFGKADYERIRQVFETAAVHPALHSERLDIEQRGHLWRHRYSQADTRPSKGSLPDRAQLDESSVTVLTTEAGSIYRTFLHSKLCLAEQDPEELLTYALEIVKCAPFLLMYENLWFLERLTVERVASNAQSNDHRRKTKANGYIIEESTRTKLQRLSDNVINYFDDKIQGEQPTAASSSANLNSGDRIPLVSEDTQV
ncbi:probable chitin deacetylase [Serendipita indica DSM 11827]|uniref:Probable chitin deacetylase n=1 Tax=Serendipita indica (strain DSM 11827) TaxID=1109443 RepID=G4TA93_SERID|nr:probable chitin deacetylase [Serendipita indica DSM 11827]